MRIFMLPYSGWIFGTLAIVIWVGCIYYYFAPWIRRSWQDRNADYFNDR